MKFVLPLLLLILSAPVQARVFNLDQQKVAFYFKGNIGTSRLERDAFVRSDGAVATITEEVLFQYAGEMGLFFAANTWGFRVGVQGIYPQVLDNVEAKNAAGNIEYNMRSRIFGVLPVVHVLYSFIQNKSVRWYVAGGGGMGSVTILNSYTFTSVSPYNLVDFTEEGTAWVPMYEGSTGLEFSLVDNVTMLVDMGYRYMLATGFKHTRAVNTFQGPVGKGDKVTNHGGAERELDMSSAYIGMGFKFYFM